MRFLKPFICTYCGVWQPSLDTKRRHVLKHRKKYLKTQRMGMLLTKSEQIGFYKVTSNIDVLRVHRRNFFPKCFSSQNHLDENKLYQCEICNRCMVGLTWLNTWKLTPKRNLFSVRFVRNILHDKVLWPNTWELTPKRNPTYVRFGSSAFHTAAIWTLTSGLAPKRNHISVRFVTIVSLPRVT